LGLPRLLSSALAESRFVHSEVGRLTGAKEPAHFRTLSVEDEVDEGFEVKVLAAGLLFVGAVSVGVRVPFLWCLVLLLPVSLKVLLRAGADVSAAERALRTSKADVCLL